MKVSRAIRLLPDGVQPDLFPVLLRGGRNLEPDHDPFTSMIDLRHRTRRDEAVVDLESSLPKYGHRADRWTELVLPVLRQMGVEEVMRRTDRSRSAVYDVLSGREMKYSGPAAVYTAAVADEAREAIARQGERTPRQPYGALRRWLSEGPAAML